MHDIDFDVPATIFLRQEGDHPNAHEYASYEFGTTAEAIKHAVEQLGGADSDFYISAATARLDRAQALEAYADPRFPLDRAR